MLSVSAQPWKNLPFLKTIFELAFLTRMRESLGQVCVMVIDCLQQLCNDSEEKKSPYLWSGETCRLRWKRSGMFWTQLHRWHELYPPASCFRYQFTEPVVFSCCLHAMQSVIVDTVCSDDEVEEPGDTLDHFPSVIWDIWHHSDYLLPAL